jgi:hypothetical protein
MWLAFIPTIVLTKPIQWDNDNLVYIFSFHKEMAMSERVPCMSSMFIPSGIDQKLAFYLRH